MSTITAKFAKDLNKFFTWANENSYLIKDKDSIINWSTDMLPNFSEPSRNKIDAYIKDLLKIYDLYDKNNIKIEDTYIKLIIKEFKDNKPTAKKSKNTNEISDDIQNSNREPKEQNQIQPTEKPKRKYTKKSKTNSENEPEQKKLENDNSSESEPEQKKIENNISESEPEQNKKTKISKKSTTKQPVKKTKKSKNESPIEQINNFNIEIEKGIIKMISQNWFIETNDHVNISYVIEYIANNKDNIIAQIEKQRNNNNNKQTTIPPLQSKIEIDESKIDDSKIDDSFEIGSPDLGTITLDDI